MSERGPSEIRLSKRGLSKRGLSKRGLSKRGLSKRGLSKRGLSKRGLSEKVWAYRCHISEPPYRARPTSAQILKGERHISTIYYEPSD